MPQDPRASREANFLGARFAQYGSPPAPSRPQPVQRLPDQRGVNTTSLRSRMLRWASPRRRDTMPDMPVVHGQMGTPGNMSIGPVRIAKFRRPPFWDPQQRYKRQEYMVEPPLLPGTAIPWTLFHPTYVGGGGAGATSPGLQGYKGYLFWGSKNQRGDGNDPRQGNFGWVWGRNNFERFGALAWMVEHPSMSGLGTTLNVWKPSAQIPQGPGTGAVWQQPPPTYIPQIINPVGLGQGRRSGAAIGTAGFQRHARG